MAKFGKKFKKKFEKSRTRLFEIIKMASTSQTKTAQKSWEMANNITEAEEIYKYDRNLQQNMLTAKPWEKDPHFFKDIKVSALALLKMVMHAR